MPGSMRDEITSIAVLVDSPGAFTRRAKEVAADCGEKTPLLLVWMFHDPPDAPPGFGPETRGLAGWIVAWQAAIAEVLYHMREVALPALRGVAFGPYDWTQANAVEILCRLAAQGIDRDRTLSDLRREMPRMRPETLDAVADALIPAAAGDARLAEVVASLRGVAEFDEALREAASQS
jgi:hypothetical protein